ncbi:MAG: LssY C-terminal domain-containing protein, partial [Pseudomonadota bacterium]
AFAFVFGPIHNEKIGRATLAALVITTLTVFGGWHIRSAFNQALITYQPRVHTEMLTASRWRDGEWRTLPDRRIELNGDREEPLVIQYAGSLDGFAAIAEKDGWQIPPKWNLTTAGGFVEGQTPPDSLPILPRTQNGRQPALVLIHKDPDEEKSGRWVLRLWPSRYQIFDNGNLQPLFLGSVVHEDILRPMGEFSGPRTDLYTPPDSENPALLIPGAVAKTRSDGTKIVLGLLNTSNPAGTDTPSKDASQ